MKKILYVIGAIIIVVGVVVLISVLRRKPEVLVGFNPAEPVEPGGGVTVVTASNPTSTLTAQQFDEKLKVQYIKDSDFDGLSAEEEQNLRTDVNNPDSDGDGILDGDEKLYKTDPLKADSDSDGMKDGAEILRGRDPLKKDGPPLTIQPSISTSSR